VSLSPFLKLKRKVLFDYLDKYPDAPSHQIARMLHRDHPLMFLTHENARISIRYYRGATGDLSRRLLATKKYLKNV